MHETSNGERIWPVSLARIEQIVSGQLGPGRVRGNEAGPCFSRQVSMYLARHVGRWSLAKIGRFYNGRHHTTVLHAVEKIERLRQSDEAFRALIEVLTSSLAPEPNSIGLTSTPSKHSALVEAIAARVIDRLVELRPANMQIMIPTE